MAFTTSEAGRQRCDGLQVVTGAALAAHPGRGAHAFWIAWGATLWTSGA